LNILPFLIIFIRKVRDKIPIPKATAVPIRMVSIPKTISTFLNSNRVAPRIAGIDSRKENLPESSLSRPQKSPVEIVAPDREIPGIMAAPWAIPIRTASTHPPFSKGGMGD
jgi:hypothetical protein